MRLTVELNGVVPHQLLLAFKGSNISALVSNGSNEARWSFFAWETIDSLFYKNKHVYINKKKSYLSLEDAFEKLLKKYSLQEKKKNNNDFKRLNCPFVSGGIGVIQYDYAFECLGLEKELKNTVVKNHINSENLLEWYWYEKVLVYDHHNEQWWTDYSQVELKKFFNFDSFHEALYNLKELKRALNLQVDIPVEKYMSDVETILDDIKMGNFYQACYSMPFVGNPFVDARKAFSSFWSQYPSTYGCFLEFENKKILSFSPEKFISVCDNKIVTHPIKGTLKRGGTPLEDEKNSKILMADQKERAELAMITDLLRNDICRVSKHGTETVGDFPELMKTPYVWHLYSRIKADLKEGLSFIELIRRIFPGGSISGCPKKSAVKRLLELEDRPRGVFTGAIGYVSSEGNIDLNIAIRTLVQYKDEVSAGFGGGIVADSLVQKEFEECYSKASPFLGA